MNPTATTTGRKAGKESDMDFTNTQHGTLPTGTVTTLGAIEASSLTAYRIDGEWVPFCRIHGQHRPVMQPLVACAEWLPKAW